MTDLQYDSNDDLSSFLISLLLILPIQLYLHIIPYSMSSDDCQVQNMYRYARKSYKKNRRGTHDNESCSPPPETNVDSDNRSDGVALDLPSCSCDAQHEGDVASILHKKCPVITLARQQLQRILEDTDKILCDSSKSCRSLYDFLCICRELVGNQNKCVCALFFLIGVAFLLGVLLGAASCGSYHGQFDSPILTCIDNFFIPDHTNALEFRGVV